MMSIMNNKTHVNRITNTTSLFGALLEDRIIMINGVIDENLSATVIAQMLYLDAIDHSPIQLYLNSPGGIASFGIYDCIQNLHSPVQTLCIDSASSMGAFLLSSGTKGLRAATPNARIMIHQIASSVGGKFTDIKIQTREMQITKDKLNKILAKNTGKSIEEIEKDTENGDYYMSAEEALEYGLIDKILYPEEKNKT